MPRVARSTNQSGHVVHAHSSNTIASHVLLKQIGSHRDDKWIPAFAGMAFADNQRNAFGPRLAPMVGEMIYQGLLIADI